MNHLVNKKIILIVSDFHLGTGRFDAFGNQNELEDFLYDHRFSEFLKHYSTQAFENCEVELIFNGDMLNLIQVDYHGHYPASITEEITCTKLQSILKGHPNFLGALRAFLSSPKRSLTYVIGNHDQEMVWPKAQSLFEQAVGYAVLWKTTFYQVDGIHVEHGHQFEPANRVDPARMFIMDANQEPILNLPWGTLFTVQFLMKLKHERPVIDKIRPFQQLIRWLLVHDTVFAVKKLVGLLIYLISSNFSRERIRQTSLKGAFRMLWEASVFPELVESAKNILNTPEIHTVVFGHTHVYKSMKIGQSKQYINTGTWTDIISLDLETFARRSRLTYVRVEYDDDGVQFPPQLRHWIGKSHLEDDAFAL